MSQKQTRREGHVWTGTMTTKSGAKSLPVLGYGNSSLRKGLSGMSGRVAGMVIAALCAVSQVLTAQTLVNFDSLSDGVAVTTQFPGVTFSNAQVLTAGFSLD